MKRILILGTAAAVLGVAAPAAQASCGTACLRTKVNTLTREVNSLTTTVQGLTNTVNALSGTVNSLGGNVTAYHNAQVSDEATLTKLTSAFSCFGEYPVTDYGDSDGTFGYVYYDGSGVDFDTTALDVTSSGNTVGAWTLFDQCNTTQSGGLARSHLARSGDAIAPSFLLDPFAR
jgi:outer membrane murein-binding lipoprotein Lpp